ncbi:MAG: hypothetical protein IKS25_01630 [Oscillospiraceae bacterium]|nr:hypothetical protein [Oscillospiraceae bacterium]
MKRVFSLLLVAALVFSLCACGGSNNQTSAAEQSKEAQKQEAVAEEVKESPAETEAAEIAETLDENGIRPQIKEAIDSYEAFVDEYCTFMTEYSLTDLSKLSTYNELISKELEMTEKFKALEDEDLNDAEALYYSEVSIRCSQKLLDVASAMLK